MRYQILVIHLKLKMWVRTKWTDTRLSWDPALWGGITTIPFNHPAHDDWEIWIPELVPYNSAASIFETLDKSRGCWLELRTSCPEA